MRGWLSLFLAMAACSPPPPPCNNFGRPIAEGSDAGAQIAVTGKPFEVTLSQFRFSSCGPGSTVDDVFTEVLDPLNRKVEHTHDTPTSFSMFQTRISFTPTLPGSYHLSARFEPSLGTAQADVQVAENRSTAPSTMLSLGTRCSALEVTASALVLCLTASPPTLRVYRGDALLQTFDADEFASAGAAVWTSRLGVVTRRLDVGGALPLGMALSLDVSCPPSTFPCPTMGQVVGALLAREDTAVAITSGEVATKVRVVSGMLVQEFRGSASPLGPGFESVVYPREPLDALLVATSQSPNNGTAGKTCALTLRPAAPPLCASAGRVDVLGADATGIWSRDDRTLRHQRLEADGGVVTSSLALPGMPHPAPGRHYQSTPVLFSTGNIVVPRWSPDGVSLESYDVPPGFILMQSSATTVRAQHPDGRQILFTR